LFIGRYEYSLDDKSRVSIPAKFREALSSSADSRLILTILDGCIAAYPYQEWLRIQGQISALGSISRQKRAFLRVYFSRATECTFDKLGRVLIPQALKTDAQIQKNVVIVGVGEKLEVWAKEKWEELVREATADPDQIADIVSELGL
jgi:MraZ protein